MLGVIIQVLTVTLCLVGLNWFLRKSIQEDIEQVFVAPEDELCDPNELPLANYRVRSRF